MAFDIAKALGGIQPAINTRRLEKIELHMIDKNPKNLYSMDGIEALADNIATVGLMEPLIVRMTPQARYMLISGHRRRAALCRLADDGRLKDGWHHKVPCMVEPDDGLILPGCPEEGEEAEEAKQLAEELKLLFANSDTRELSSADKAMQVRQLREVLSRLRDLGADLPGRMRDHVAAAAKVSPTRVARLDVIDKGLTDPRLRKAWEAGKLSETSAYEIARQDKDVQRLAADRVGAKALGGMSTDQVTAVMEACEADGNRDREAAADWNRNVGTMAEETKAAGAAGKVKSDFSADAYLEKLHEEDTILRELCRKNIHSILHELMFFKSEYNFDENSRLANIDRMRKNDRYSSYSVGWNANDGTGTWIDWDSKGIDVNFGRRPKFHKSWTDFYDVLCGAALDKVWKSAEPVSRADTDEEDDEEDGEGIPILSAAWQTGEPVDDGRYFCRVLIGEDERPHEQRMEWNAGGWRVFGNPADKYQIQVVAWWPLPPEV